MADGTTLDPHTTPRPRGMPARNLLGAATLGGLLMLAAATPSHAQEPAPAFDEGQRQAIEEIIADYILDNPELVYRALQVLQERQQAAEAERAKLALDTHREALERDPNSPVGGNPAGDVTVVEFFDYQCPYCKRAAPAVDGLVEGDGEIRVVYKEWPILGPVSVFAARAALAARQQDRYAEFHERVMALEKVTEAGVMAVVRDLGMDVDQLRADMDAAEVVAHLEQTNQLARVLGITGTPAFVIGDEIVPGAASRTALEDLVDRARRGS
jgi:protein-disulfide isomerase